MNKALPLFVITALTAIATAQSPKPSVVACSKTISFAMAEGGQPVPAIPKFTAKWIDKKYHVQAHPELCLSQIPSSKSANYLVIFSTSEASFNGLSPSAHTYSNSGPASGLLAGISSYGGTWSYVYTGIAPPPPTSSTDLQHIDASKKELVIRAYDDRGRQVSHYSVDADHNREKLLVQVMDDIHHDEAPTPDPQHVVAPLPVYYVNCDVDSSAPASLMAAHAPTAALSEARPATPSPPPTPPETTLELWSSPAGAEIYLDGKLIGKTPFTAIVSPGEHAIVMQKQDFSTWQRRIQAAPGPRRVAAYLDRQILTIPSGSQ
jgi:hypothetical protein